MARVLLLSEANSIHTYRWVLALRARGVEVGLFSLRASDWYDYVECGVPLYSASIGVAAGSRLLSKWRYLSALSVLRRAIGDFAPDIVHAHYATSYGLLGALSGFRPLIVSVWGTDVYDFPIRVFGGGALLRYIFRRADRLLSTSHMMVQQASRYTDKPLTVTPFGVESQHFNSVGHADFDPDLFGCVKSLHRKYGIDLLITAFAEVVRCNTARNLRLEIVGEGVDRGAFEALTRTLGVETRVHFTGFIANDRLPAHYSRYLVSIFPSVCNESFGVVAIESMACGCPAIASEVDGFRETVVNGETGYLVPRGDVAALVEAMQRFLDDPSLRDSFGAKARARVLALYNWDDNVETMLRVYREVLDQFGIALNAKA